MFVRISDDDIDENEIATDPPIIHLIHSIQKDRQITHVFSGDDGLQVLREKIEVFEI